MRFASPMPRAVGATHMRLISPASLSFHTSEPQPTAASPRQATTKCTSLVGSPA